jgi:hypothetical protein
MDLPDDSLILTFGLNVEGKLVFPDGYRITIETPYIVVQGELEMSSTRATSGEEDVKIIMIEKEGVGGGIGDVYFTPHPENEDECPEGGCKIGTRPIAVLGGILDIKGLPDDCPSWVKLKNVVTSSPSFDSSQMPSYIPPAPGCADDLIATSFEGNTGISYPNGWYLNYDGAYFYETEDAATPGSTYVVFQGRNDSWNGPQTNFNPSCVVPGTYFITAKARLTKSGGLSNCHQHGTDCLKLTSYFQDSDIGSIWGNRGEVGKHNDGEWFDFVHTTTFTDKTADTTTAIERRLYWEGPEAGVDIALDDVR